jgi:hypothetical protein
VFKKTLALVGLSVLTLSANAALYDPGNSMIYDDVLVITWLQGANYAKTSNYDSDGRMTKAAATIWVNKLVYAGHNQWRLISTLNDNSLGPNINSGELGH